MASGRKAFISPDKLDFYIEHNWNVLFEGKHGVGKTAMVLDAFDRANLKWKYFSASTMDPWVDFIGVPKPVRSKKTGETFLKLIRPQAFATDTVEAIFMDELNRSHAKVRNAVMELIQFRSINGRKFNNLRMVWAAINPDGDEDGDSIYDVEKLDPAQKDRFQIQIQVPYICSVPFFSDKYGKKTATAAVSWWNELPDEQKDLVSPRRLDSALEVNKAGGELRDVLPASSNLTKLATSLKSGPIAAKLLEIIEEGDTIAATDFLSVENNYTSAIKTILKRKAFREFFFPLLTPEKLSDLIANNNVAYNFVIRRLGVEPIFSSVVTDIVGARANYQLCRKIIRNKFYSHHIREGSEVDVNGHAIPKYADFVTNDECETYVEKEDVPSNLRTISGRKEVLEKFSDYIPRHISTDVAVKLIDLLDKICIRVRASTLESTPNFMGHLNHIFGAILENENYGWEEFERQFNDKISNLLKRIEQSNFLLSQFAYKDFAFDSVDDEFPWNPVASTITDDTKPLRLRRK